MSYEGFISNLNDDVLNYLDEGYQKAYKNGEIHEMTYSRHINFIIKNGKLEYFKVIQRNGRNCHERLYSESGKYYLQTGVGLNGYLVSAYPISEKEALALIRRNKNDK